MDNSHPDFDILNRIREGLFQRLVTLDMLKEKLPSLVADAIEFVIDPVRTARTSIEELDNVEKTFVGLKVEHFFRDFIDLPKGIRDLRIEGFDLDIKNTIGKTWMIPPETYRQEEACLLIASATKGRTCSLGLLVARDGNLTKPNRDGKRGVSKLGRQSILWLIKEEPMPKSRWEGIEMVRFRELRKLRGGKKRAAAFFRENQERPVHRAIVQALLFDQNDYMKRLRENGGARDLLWVEGILLLSGAFDRLKIARLNLPPIERDEFIAVKCAID